jgi:hypothetical protein
VFDGLDFFSVAVCLFLKRYDWLARRFVRFPGDVRGDAEVIALLEDQQSSLDDERNLRGQRLLGVSVRRSQRQGRIRDAGWTGRRGAGKHAWASRMPLPKVRAVLQGNHRPRSLRVP